MRRDFKLPDVGEGLTEAEIVRWHVKQGEAVKVNQIVVEIETAKSIVELPIPWDGLVAELLADEGQTVDVGVAIISVETEEAPGGTGEGGRAETGRTEGPGQTEGQAGRIEALADDMVPHPPLEGAVEPGTHGGPAPKEQRQAVLVGYGVKTGATRRRPRRPAAQAPPVTTPARAEVASPAQPVAENGATGPAAGRGAVLAKPPVRKLAKDLGVDLATIAGTGPEGSITRDDVHAASRPVAAAAPARQGEERIPVKGVRRMTAQAMVASAFTAPHVTEFLQVDVTETMDAVRRLRALPDFAEVKVSPLLLVAKAVLTAAGRHPMINSSWDEEAQEIVVKHYVHLGIAAATPRGLVVPNVKNAHELSLPELARRLGELAETARAGRTQPAEMAGGTITITNVGVFGVDAGTPLLNPGEAAILAFGQVRDMPWVVDGELAVRKVTTLALSFDHRIVDGELGSMFLRDVGAMLEDPLRMLAWS
ncbi:dihydrolipoamide acetyltransferase family protein [Nonomuraea cavernae]|uniref:Dihydrolipoamide acetyltransferase component of pyruvate dehydrogenase complex n=1 Tax=Nonomuraea cavernae TaxID=2045107 RepID=A0A918DE70_9ACTN|nr:dihydrolipoamide acetyltransferase family protein [Nonomuraea cavernae]MCA2183471.1 2-oxo acid dehydrogenase subunit E2 [Nonomuraea cavernae]GGO60399.1 dihydrolipoamide acetyltransferase component of pyruvate dehydrogenase complex [Nonomuraea cavernae]